jgi:hypothetical protein
MEKLRIVGNNVQYDTKQVKKSNFKNRVEVGGGQ